MNLSAKADAVQQDSTLMNRLDSRSTLSLSWFCQLDSSSALLRCTVRLPFPDVTPRAVADFTCFYYSHCQVHQAILFISKSGIMREVAVNREAEKSMQGVWRCGIRARRQRSLRATPSLLRVEFSSIQHFNVEWARSWRPR